MTNKKSKWRILASDSLEIIQEDHAQFNEQWWTMTIQLHRYRIPFITIQVTAYNAYIVYLHVGS